MTSPGTTSLWSRADPAEAQWRRLDPRMLVIGPIYGLARLAPLVVVVLVSGHGDPTRVWIAAGIAVLVVLGAALNWRTTRYRITPERVELHSGWLNRQRRSVPRDRIRTVDLTAPLLHRLIGLSVVQVSAGVGGGSAENAGLKLDAVSGAEADRLRRELLERATPAATVDPPVHELARLHWSWLRLAPLTFSSLAGIGAIIGTGFNLLDEFGIDPREVGAAAERFNTAPLWLTALGLLLALTVIGAIGLYAERWYGYRLTREPGADGRSALRVARGLLTRRSLSVAEERLRGAEVVEPLLLRAGRGAQCRALATGLSAQEQGGALQPPVPREEAHRVASVAMHERPELLTVARLHRHPRAALRRRLTRAILPAALLVGAAFAIGAVWPGLAFLGPWSLVLLPLAALLGFDRYRNLGHRLTDHHLITRQGSLVRRTVALQREGIIGWRIRQSVLQRAAGLLTLEAVTAAGRGGYEIPDVSVADAVALLRSP